MCDPVSIGLVVAGSALKSYGDMQVASASKRDINKAGQDYQEERARQQGFTQEQQGTVADTLKTYSPEATMQRQADATDVRQKAYTSPLESKNFVAPMTADADPNSAVMLRNQATGQAQKSKSIAEALAKGKLDAYGDAQTQGNILGNLNANKLSMVQRIARGSQAAGNMEQGTLQSKLQADAHQGDTFHGIGDLFTTAAMLGTGAGGWSNLGGKLFGGTIAPMTASAPSAFGTITATTPELNYPGMFGFRL